MVEAMNLARFKSSFLVLFCFLYGVTYKPSRAGQNSYTWCCYPQWMYLQVTMIKIYLSIYLSSTADIASRAYPMLSCPLSVCQLFLNQIGPLTFLQTFGYLTSICPTIFSKNLWNLNLDFFCFQFVKLNFNHKNKSKYFFILFWAIFSKCLYYV